MSSQAQECETGECAPPTTTAQSSHHQAAASTSSSSASASAPRRSAAKSTTNEHDPALLDPTTFIAPTPQSSLPRIVIEFCDRCRWLHRATWVQTELFLTFPTSAEDPQKGIRAIALVPRTSPETGGRFRVWIYRVRSDPGKSELVWDRKIEGGFPELKELKQRIRNLIEPEKSLGHSDGHKKTNAAENESPASEARRQGSQSENPETDDLVPVIDDYTPRFRC